ncbi:MAG TPA: TetR/AcrR family transcriptional regulator [Friedmanniella sp.]
MDLSSSPSAGPTQGRERQRRRTRTAIIDAASRLVAAGGTPSVGEIAEAADVSRRTVYQYFPTLEQLLLDATVGLISRSAVDEALEDDGRTDPVGHVVAAVRALDAESARTLPLGRSLLRLTVADPPASEAAPRRGYRRVEWLDRALGPLRDQLRPESYDRLVSALSVVVGWESLVVLADVRGLDRDAQAETVAWAAEALVRAALAEG